MTFFKKATLIATVLSSAIAGAVTKPVEMSIAPEHVFLPYGFDSNDSVEFVVSGWLPNLCYKYPSSNVMVEGKKIKVELKSLYYRSMNCPQVALPFVETVKVGIIDEPGSYEVVVNEATNTEKKDVLEISETSGHAVDNYTYAEVEYIDKALDDSRTVTLRGYNPSDCFKLKKVEIFDNKKDTYSILPIMEQVSSFCPMKMVPFNYKVTIPNTLPSDKVLLHVRSMNGRSVNSILQN